MPKYRRIPTVIEAEQFNPPFYIPFGVKIENGGKPFVTTIHGQRAYLEPGDWILPEPDGEHFYPCKPDVFQSTYERV